MPKVWNLCVAHFANNCCRWDESHELGKGRSDEKSSRLCTKLEAKVIRGIIPRAIGCVVSAKRGEEAYIYNFCETQKNRFVLLFLYTIKIGSYVVPKKTEEWHKFG